MTSTRDSKVIEQCERSSQAISKMQEWVDKNGLKNKLWTQRKFFIEIFCDIFSYPFTVLPKHEKNLEETLVFRVCLRHFIKLEQTWKR